jgi:hypothetical protein
MTGAALICFASRKAAASRTLAVSLIDNGLRTMTSLARVTRFVVAVFMSMYLRKRIRGMKSSPRQGSNSKANRAATAEVSRVRAWIIARG